MSRPTARTPQPNTKPLRTESPSTEPPSPTPGVSRRRALRDQILLLRKALPSNLELIKIMDEHPNEGTEFVEYCRTIEGKIRVLEEERKRLTIEQEEERRESVKQTAVDRYKQRKKKIINNWMHKELSAEDRLAQREEERRKQVEEKRLEEMALKEELAKMRNSQQTEMHHKLAERRVRWNRAVSAVEEAKRDAKLEVDYKLHEKGLTFAARMAELRRQEETRQQQLEEQQRRRNRELQDHIDRAKEKEKERQKIAHQLSAKPLAHPKIKQERIMQTTNVLHDRTEKQQAYLHKLYKEQDEKIDNMRQTRDRKLTEAQLRLKEKQEAHQRRLREVESELERRLKVHDDRIQERERVLEERRRQNQTKIDKCREAVSSKIEGGHTAISQRLIDRTLRIGNAFGIARDPLILPANTSDNDTSSPPSNSTSVKRTRTKRNAASHNGQHLEMLSKLEENNLPNLCMLASFLKPPAHKFTLELLVGDERVRYPAVEMLVDILSRPPKDQQPKKVQKPKPTPAKEQPAPKETTSNSTAEAQPQPAKASQPAKAPRKIDITVLSASDLHLGLDEATADQCAPYAVIRDSSTRNELVCTAKTRDSLTVNPTWCEGNCCSIEVQNDADAEDKEVVEIEIWSTRAEASEPDDFIGRVLLTRNLLLQHDGDVSFPLSLAASAPCVLIRVAGTGKRDVPTTGPQ